MNTNANMNGSIHHIAVIINNCFGWIGPLINHANSTETVTVVGYNRKKTHPCWSRFSQFGVVYPSFALCDPGSNPGPDLCTFMVLSLYLNVWIFPIWGFLFSLFSHIIVTRCKSKLHDQLWRKIMLVLNFMELYVLKTLDNIGYCQRLVFSPDVSHHMHEITNLW